VTRGAGSDWWLLKVRHTQVAPRQWVSGRDIIEARLSQDGANSTLSLVVALPM